MCKHGFSAVLAVFFSACSVWAQEPKPEQSTVGPVPPPSAGLGVKAPAGGGSTVTISGVPCYLWRHGCGPTAVGMVVGYYDSNGFPNLFDGEASSQTESVDQGIASQGSGVRGSGTQLHYENYSLPDDSTYASVITDSSAAYPTGCHSNDSIADFMRTSWSSADNNYGWSWSTDISPSFTSYVGLKNSAYIPDAKIYYTGSSLTWAVVTNEIANNRPMVFLVDSSGDGFTDHFVTVIGFSDATPRLYACYDTWYTSVRWCLFREMSSAYTWGVWGGWSFSVTTKAPTDLFLSCAEVQENRPTQTVVGAFGTRDSETGDTFTYSLVGGQGSADNGLFSISGSNLLTAAVFDYEAKTNCSILVRTTDHNGLTFDKPFTITIGNQSDFYTLAVASAYGGCVPAGTNSYHLNTSVIGAITNSLIPSSPTQNVCCGWAGTGSVPPAGSTTNTGSFRMTNDSTLAWQWATIYRLVTQTNGNGLVTAGGWCVAGSNALLTARAGYHWHFAGWSGDTNGCELAGDHATVPMMRARDITANFAIDQHALTVMTPYGKAKPAAGTSWYSWGSSLAVALTNSPVLNGTTQYVCVGWAGTGSVPGVGLTTNTGPVTLTNDSSVSWQWSTNVWLKVLTNGSGTVGIGADWFAFGTNVSVTATPGSSWRFSGWSGQTNGCTISGNTISILMDRARTNVTAAFIRQYSLVVTSLYGGVSPPLGTNWIDAGTSFRASVTNSPVVSGATQYVCRGWVGTGNIAANGTATNTASVALTANSTIRWLWGTNYWLDVGCSGQGKLSTNDCWVGKGASLLITATASNHWHFAAWSGQTDGCTLASNKITVAMDKPRAVVSAFEVDRHKLVVTSPYGLTLPAKGTNWFDYGSALYAAVTNAPVLTGETQYFCKGWVGSGSLPASGAATNAGLFTLTNDSAIVWRWQTNYWLNTGAEGGGTVNVGDGWLARGTNVQMTATASNYWFFGNWKGTTNGCTLASNTITVAMSGPRQVTAVLKPDLATNSVPKWWLFHYGLTNFNSHAMQDVDGDGHMTWQEYVTGSIPTNRDSVFRSRITLSNGVPWVTWTPDLGSQRVYAVAGRTNLTSGAWEPRNSGSRFFKVHVDLP